MADLSSAIQKTEEIIQIRGFKDRCQVVECDFFNAIPSGSDVYLMSNILHDWSDEPCRIILRNCKNAMKRKSRLLVVEMIVPAGNAPSIAKLLDLEMSVMKGGRERTAGEFNNLFESINFKLSRIIPTKEDVCIIEAIPL